ncbi:hypothetical protein QBC37DRAFT_278441 [Rhypophila decipiens]|uniref:Vegetative cell wall protein gp1 n=1 Tax=Rhypophila decipiens TaxID=261697 RepID=A0AAN7BDD0_9PEZI|nr:hypothetical protein QBC37DRAFT_278441 [Rhypophila decipiens]
MGDYSSYGGNGASRDYYQGYDKTFGSPSQTPSPRASGSFFGTGATPQRPATRAHFRNPSAAAFAGYSSPRGPSFSPRYTSDGTYATANVSSSGRKPASSGQPHTRRERRNSYSYYRASDHHGESDEDEFVEIDGRFYMLPSRSKWRRYGTSYYTVNAGGHPTDYHYYAQAGVPMFNEAPSGYQSPQRFDVPERKGTAVPGGGHHRRNSTSVPQRPQTAAPRPASSHKKPAPRPKQATPEDAKRHGIPSGYSLKNWDPTEEPIMLLGSVFDANSLGKWIYDWTVYHHGPATPISDMAGEMWLLLIQLAGKLKRADEAVPKIRAKDNREMVVEFIEAGDRLTDKLRKLLKACEAPMLRSSATKRKDPQLGKNAGVEFVETLFGRERELEKTERFMTSVRLWNLRFDANCEEILRKPGL